jgi:hypothetical protein
MANLLYIEIAFDQAEMLQNFQSAASELGHSVKFLFKNNKMVVFYQKYGLYGVSLENLEYKFKRRNRAWLMEKMSRLIAFDIVLFKYSDIRDLVLGIPDLSVYCFVGPEAIKRQVREICKKYNINFYFLDQTPSGNIYSGEFPFSATRNPFRVEENNAAIDYIDILNRPRKSLISGFLDNIRAYRADGLVRAFEAVYSYFYRLIIKIILKFIQKNINIKEGAINIILAPQAFTEAAYSYGTKGLKSPLAQLIIFSERLKKYCNLNISIRLHPISGDRIRINDIFMLLKAKIPLRKMDESLNSAFQACNLIVTINSNIGYEAILRNIPVICLGTSYYHRSPLCYDGSKKSFDITKIYFQNQLSTVDDSFSKKGLIDYGIDEKNWDKNSLIKIIKINSNL